MTELEKSIMKVISLYFDDSTVYASEMHSQIMDAISIVPMNIESAITELPQRTWVGLTYEDMVSLQKDLHDSKGEIVLPTTFAKAVEAKLREKNG
jgi:threonine synthase